MDASFVATPGSRYGLSGVIGGPSWGRRLHSRRALAASTFSGSVWRDYAVCRQKGYDRFSWTDVIQKKREDMDISLQEKGPDTVGESKNGANSVLDKIVGSKGS